MRRRETQVLVAGGGPVGLTLAMDLVWRGVDVIVLEMRAAGDPPSVKCNHVSARTMEIFRRLGLARAVRDAGLPPDYPNDIAFRTTITGPEIGRIPIPCRAERYTARGGPDTWWPTSEPPHRINQIYLEPVLARHAAGMANLDLRHRTKVLDFVQSESGVVARADDLTSGETFEVACDYMVACDGGHSALRRQIGAKLTGDTQVERRQSTYFRAPSLLSRMQGKPAWVTFGFNPRRSGNVFAIDGRETWVIHNILRPNERFDEVDRDRCIRTILGVDASFEYEIISQEDWTARRMIADRFRDRRVFLCGDAAHIWVPNAGYGMNAGIADATNLSWMMAAVLDGWAPARILDAHEAERMPITEQVSRYAMNVAQSIARQRSAIPADIEEPGAAGDASRTRIAREAYDINVGQFCCGGLNFGSFYEASPIIAYDGASPPSYTLYDFTPSTVPGCRTPHLWLADNTSLYDVVGPGYTLLRFDRTVEVAGMLDAAGRRGLPLALVDIDTPAPPYAETLVLSRPDQHVAWRGYAQPTEPLDLIDRVRGAAIA